MKKEIKQVNQYLLYVPTPQGTFPNWKIEYYDLFHDLQDRAETLEIQEIPHKIVIEYTDGTKEPFNFNQERR